MNTYCFRYVWSGWISICNAERKRKNQRLILDFWVLLLISEAGFLCLLFLLFLYDVLSVLWFTSFSYTSRCYSVRKLLKCCFNEKSVGSLIFEYVSIVFISGFSRKWPGDDGWVEGWLHSSIHTKRKQTKKIKPRAPHKILWNQTQVDEMAQEVKVLASKPDDLSSIPGSHTTKGENQLLKVVLCFISRCHGTVVPHTFTYTQST